MGDVLRVAADQHELSCSDPGGVFDRVCRLQPPVVVFDETSASGSGREEFLDDLGSAFVLDAEQILALRRAIIPVNERFPALEKDDEEHRSGLPGPLRPQPIPELCSFVYVRDRLDFRLRPFDEGLEGFIVHDLVGSRLGPGSPARQHDQCQDGKGRRCLEVKSHRILLHGVANMNFRFIKSYQSITGRASLPRMGLILGSPRSWRYIMALLRKTTTSISVVQAREKGI